MTTYLPHLQFLSISSSDSMQFTKHRVSDNHKPKTKLRARQMIRIPPHTGSSVNALLPAPYCGAGSCQDHRYQSIHSCRAVFPRPGNKKKTGAKQLNGESPNNNLSIYEGKLRRKPRMDSIYYRLSTRLSAPRTRQRSSLILGGGGPSSSLPSIARRRCVFWLSRSSKRCEQMRSIRDETASAEARYSSMSCTPAANASSVGTRPDVMRDNRADTADGVIGGRVEVEGDESSSDD